MSDQIPQAPSSVENPISEQGPSQEVDVSVVIVNYNVKDFLSQALRSVYQAAEGLNVEVFVVDNNSIDASVAMVQRDYPLVTLIANNENVGFGKANNQAIRLATGRHVLILNPDTIVQEDSLRAMAEFMDSHPECGALGCQIFFPDGSFAPESRRSFPTPEIAFFRMIGMSTLFPSSKRFGKYNLTYLSKEEECEVDALSGSCMMVRRDALYGNAPNVRSKRQANIFFDEDFFMYGEDLDLCYRIKQAGWQIWYTPSTQIIHYKGESTKKGEIRYVRLFYGAMLLFIEKHLEFQHSPVLLSLLRAGIMLRAGLTLLGNAIKASTSTLLDFVSMYAVVALLGSFRFSQTNTDPTALFFLTIAPAFALATVLGIAVSGGYRTQKTRRIEPVLTGVGIGFLTVASLAYFVQSIAFSRWVVGLAVPMGIIILVFHRLVASRKKGGTRKALMVGGASEATRLSSLLSSHPRPPFRLAGYVSDTEDAGLEASRAGTPEADAPDGSSSEVRRIGRLSHLRDLVRLKGYSDLVFASRDIPNHVIFGIMRSLKDLPVPFRMLQEGGELVIGKSTISHLSLGSLQGGMTDMVHVPSGLSSFLFARFFALFSLPFWPFLWLARQVGPKDTAKLDVLLQLPRVLIGKQALVGCKPEHAEVIPASWNIPIGLFPVTNTMATKELEPEDIARAYWYYVTHQTPGLDLEIIVASLRTS